MAKPGQLKFETAAWSQMVSEIIATEGHRRVTAIADACNAESGLGDGGYVAGTEGKPSKVLRQDDYRATVITATEAAMHDNAVNNRLVNNLYRGADAGES